MKNNTRNIEIPDDESETVVIRGSIKVAFNSNGGITVYTNGDVAIRPAANDDAKAPASAAPKPGDKMPDGTVYAGISPETGEPMYTTPADAPLTMQWREATDYAAGLDAHGHKDWRLPSKAELNVLFNNRAAIGGFNTSGSFPAGYYWSSSEDTIYGAWNQRFSDGSRYNFYYKCNGLSVRCVRS